MKTPNLVLVLAAGACLPSVRATPIHTSACRDAFGDHATNYYIVGVGLNSSDRFWGSIESAVPERLSNGCSVDIVGGSVMYLYEGRWMRLNLTPGESACRTQFYPFVESLTLHWQGSMSIKESYGVSVNLPGMRKCYIGASGVDRVLPSHLLLMCVTPAWLESSVQALGFFTEQIDGTAVVGNICSMAPVAPEYTGDCWSMLEGFVEGYESAREADEAAGNSP